ncbi:MAG: hypothetical protein M3P18_21800, partial [Actinomycetota bacterium]|nr:hypothetical protein [Actinomycetota bacterium]
MSYLYIDDRFAQHPKVAGVSDKAFRAHVLALCYCGGHLTDGALSRAAAKTLGISPRIAQELVSANLWESNENGWRVHDYLDWQDSRDEVLARRTKASAAGKARARGAKREGGRFTSATESTSAPLVETLVLAGPARPAEAPASPSPAPSPSPRELASSSLREVRDAEGRLARAFAKIGCADDALAQRLLADDAIAVIVAKLEGLAEKPGKNGASPSSRITAYLRACEDTLAEERDRVRANRATPDLDR